MSGWVRTQPFQVEHRSATFDELDEFDPLGRVMRKSQKVLRLAGRWLDVVPRRSTGSISTFAGPRRSQAFRVELG